ncbi:folliculin [Harmonia axyridis]|uniref:folliculin n=1 Tax=Harmonia axyridis TaxID=115357 RepID=UPI001E278BA0|nr:folliculin [Harmonia axyridis]XP_045463271.1 folliculin [Harmonia axyridis]
MDAILALGHFCESHGPCVVLCTQKCKEEPQQTPHNLTVPWCEACQSVDLDLALVTKSETSCFVTTRTPLQQDLAFLLKQAIVRSLSCEEESSKEGGTLYFGDNERGHIISHSFSLQDSLARGFHRKYSILMLMKDKIHLLNLWPSVIPTIKQIASELQEKAAKVNGVEQAQYSQRAVRQAQGSPGHQSRSLPQLTGEPAVFAHLHMWFTWILSCNRFVEKVANVPKIPIKCVPKNLRNLLKEMTEHVFRVTCYCVLTGMWLQCEDESVLDIFKQLIPTNFKIPSTGPPVKLVKQETWKIEWTGILPNRLPTLQILIEEALKNDSITDEVLESHLTSLILNWLNIAKSLSWTSNPDNNLLQALGISRHDLPLLAYWTSNCR